MAEARLLDDIGSNCLANQGGSILYSRGSRWQGLPSLVEQQSNKSQLFSYSVEDTDLLSQLSSTSAAVSQLLFLSRSLAVAVDMFFISVVDGLLTSAVGFSALVDVGAGSSALTASFSTSTHL